MINNIFKEKPDNCPVCNAKVVEEDYFKEHCRKQDLCTYSIVGKGYWSEGCEEGDFVTHCHVCGRGIATLDFAPTAGDIREIIKNLPDDAPIYYQRIEDSYFNEEGNGWKSKCTYVLTPCDYFNICDDVVNGKCKENCDCSNKMIRNHNAWVGKDNIGRKALFLSAHY